MSKTKHWLIPPNLTQRQRDQMTVNWYALWNPEEYSFIEVDINEDSS